MTAHDLIFHLIKLGGPIPTVVMSYVTIGADDYVEYIGIAPRGSATSGAFWQIYKLTYSGTNATSITTAIKEQIYDNRVGLTYA